MSNKNDWLQNIPEDIRSYIFLIFKVALLIFHHNHVILSDYSKVLKHLDSTQEHLYMAEMVIHLIIKVFVNGLLIWLILLNVCSIARSWGAKKRAEGINRTKD